MDGMSAMTTADPASEDAGRAVACARVGGRLRIAPASAEEREEIYRLRHEVYARELGQHPPNAEGRLRDALDDHNVYFVASDGRGIAGFISVTPPTAPAYSIDKYFPREQIPIAFDGRLFEARLLTVLRARRRRELALALMYACLRWVEEQGGTRIVALGRREILSIYHKVGLRPLGLQVQSGAVAYELVSETVGSIRDALAPVDRLLARIEAGIDWGLDIPYRRTIGCFHGGSFFDAIGVEFDRLDRRDSVINADVLDAWFPPAPGVIGALEEALPWLARTSPPIWAEGMINAVAHARGLNPDCILPGAGSSHLIYLALTRWLTPSSTVAILDPTYAEYPHVLERVVGCRVRPIPLRREAGYRLDPDELGTHIAAVPDWVVLVNPNTPTGSGVPRDALEGVIARADPRTRFWIDEAYGDYWGAEQSMEKFAAGRDNVFVCKSMSKAYALSGLRAAYLCGSPTRIRELRAFCPPWIVGLPAQVAAVRALQDPDYYSARYRQTAEFRGALAEGLASLGDVEVVSGTANFLLCHLAPDDPTTRQVIAECRSRGLFLRDPSTASPRLGPRALRVAVKDASINARIIRILGSVLRMARGRRA